MLDSAYTPRECQVIRRDTFFRIAVVLALCPILIACEQYVVSKECPVIGNSKTSIYHIPGDRIYGKMLRENKEKKDNRVCFQSASEAETAGYRRSKSDRKKFLDVFNFEEVIALLAVLAVGFGLGRFRRAAVENRGEAAVRRALTQNFTGASYHPLNNITLPFGDGTTQIDHVLVSKYGIFVVESKHYSGRIFANPSSPTWTQVISKQKRKFQNPLRQNYKHLKAIRQVLDFIPSEHIHSLVAFTGDAEFKTERPTGVFDVTGLVQHIKQFTSEVLTENMLQFCVGRLECHRKLISGQTDVEHQAYLNRKHGDAT